MYNNKALRCSSAAGALLWAFVGAGSALAQTAKSAPAQDGANATQVEEVVVTGSRFRGVAPVGSPVIGVSRSDIVEAGKNNTSDILREIPQVVSLGANEALGGSGQDATANQSRAQGLNIRGLGTRATLVLWNGSRVVGMGGFGNFVDPSTFPTTALERVEIVADGASAVYGSDAVAGVVNIITRKGFDGAEVSGRYGAADGGYTEKSYSAMVGKTWDGGHLTAAYEGGGHSRLLATKRDFVTSDQRPFGGADFRSTFCAPGNLTVPGSTTNYPLPAGTGVGLTAAQLSAGAPNRCDLQALATITPKQHRDTGLISFAQNLTPGLEIYADAFATKRTFENANVPTATVTVASTNPFFVTPVAGAKSVAVAYNFFPEVGYTYTPGYEKARQVVAGARFALPGDWRGEVSGAYGKSHDLTDNEHQANAAAITAAAALTDPTTALNVFGSGGNNNKATLSNLFNGLFVIRGSNTLKSINGNVQGSLFSLPGGKLRLSIGAEYREEANTGSVTVGTNAAPLTASPFAASREIRSIFGEVYAPLITDSNVVGLNALVLTAALRNEHYSDVGQTTNPKFGFTWTLVPGLSARGSYGRSFRAPAIPEANFKSAGFGINVNTALADPQSPTGVSNGISIVGGNPDLRPETSSTYTFGVDWRPPAIPGLSVSSTYFTIDYRNQIADIVNPAVLQSSFYSAYVTRNPTAAQISAALNFGGSALPINMGALPATISFIVDARRHNLGETRMNGFDLDASYRLMTNAGDWTFQANATRLTKLEVSAAPGAPLVDVNGRINRPSKFRARAGIGYRTGGLSAQLAANYTTGYLNDLVVTATTPAYHIRANTTYDLNVGYALDGRIPGVKTSRLALSVSNLFDRDPPHSDTALGYDPQSASALGRVVALSFTAGF